MQPWKYKKRCLRCAVACALSLNLWATWLVFLSSIHLQSHGRPRQTRLAAAQLPIWSQNEDHSNWISNSVLWVNLNNSELAMDLANFSLSLEKDGVGRTMSNVGGFQSGNLPIFKHPALCHLISLLQQPLCSFLVKRRRGVPPASLEESARCSDLALGCQVEHLWVNVNRPGHYNHLHEHGPALLSRAASVIYYPNQGDRISDDVSSFKPPTAKLRFYEGGRAVELEPSPGMLVIFPTNLLHEVDPVWVGSPSPRISIAFNLFVRWLDHPLLQAAYLGDTATVRLELKVSPVNLSDPELKFQAIHLAAEGGYLELVELLLDEGADPHAETLEKWCPLCLAAAQGHFHIVKYLQPKGGKIPKDEVLKKKIDAIDLRRGFSGLEDAVLISIDRGHTDIVEYLTQDV